MINEKILATGRGAVHGTVHDGQVLSNAIYKVAKDKNGLTLPLKKYDMVEVVNTTEVQLYGAGTFVGIVGTLGETPTVSTDRTVVLYTQGTFYKDSINNLPMTLPTNVVDNGITISFNL